MVKIYCKEINHVEKDRNLDVKDHEELDDLPRKSVGQQVEAFLLAGQNLEMSRRAMFELEDIPDDMDFDDLDTGLDEFSDLHDFYQAQKDLNEKFVRVNALRKEVETKRKQEKKQEAKQEKKQEAKQEEQKVDKNEKVE